MSKIVGDMAGCYSPLGKTFIFTDDEGTEITGVVTEQEQVFSASVADVKIGKTFASDEGVKTGEDTKTYRTTQSSRCILPNESYSIPLDDYDKYNYTKFQCIIAKFNTSLYDSVATNKIAYENNVYEVNSTTSLSQITKNQDAKSIDLNIVNNTDDTYVVHYFTYKEE